MYQYQENDSKYLRPAAADSLPYSYSDWIIYLFFLNNTQIGDIIVCSTDASLKGSKDSIFRLFDIAKVINILEEYNYTVILFSNTLHSYTFKIIPKLEKIINLDMIKMKIAQIYRTDGLTVVLDNLCVQKIWIYLCAKYSVNDIDWYKCASKV